jgi:hypothetical protein
MLLPLVLSLVAASPLDEVDVAKDILHRLLQASTYAEGARPEVFTVHANGLSYENIAGGAFALRNETLSAVFHRGPLRISNLQVRYPSNRNLDGLSKISYLILNRIATNVAKVLVPQMFSSAEFRWTSCLRKSRWSPPSHTPTSTFSRSKAAECATPARSAWRSFASWRSSASPKNEACMPRNSKVENP